MADWTLDYFLRYQWTTGPVLRNNHSVDPGGSGIVKWRRSWWAWSQSAPPRSLWKTWHSWLPLSAMYSCWLQMVTAEYYYPLSNHLDHLCLQLAWRCPQLVEHNRRNRGPKETIKETVVITVNELRWLMQGLSRCCTNGQSQVSSLINKLNGDNKKMSLGWEDHGDKGEVIHYPFIILWGEMKQCILSDQAEHGPW